MPLCLPLFIGTTNLSLAGFYFTKAYTSSPFFYLGMHMAAVNHGNMSYMKALQVHLKSDIWITLIKTSVQINTNHVTIQVF